MEQPRPSEWRAVMKLGDVGSDVSAWRFVLHMDNFSLSGAHNAFERSVHNATVAWQKARGLLGDGIVGAKSRAAINAEVIARPQVGFDPARVPYVEAVHWQHDVGPVTKDLIVLHCMEYPETSTSAEWCADFFAGRRGPAPKSSANYCVDADTVICTVPANRIAWHAPGANRRGIGIEHAGYARQSRAQWLDEYSLRMLHLSAELVAWLCSEHEIPVAFIMAEHVKHGARGITTHAEVTKAFPEKGTHWDPGPHFPIGEYLRFVGEARQRL